ncbi:putative TPR domain-containing protein, partial [Reticulomyxa filosa]
MISAAEEYKKKFDTFVTRWKQLVEKNELDQCEQFCVDAISHTSNQLRIFEDHKHNNKSSGSSELIEALHNFRSQIRHMYGTLLQNYLERYEEAVHQYDQCIQEWPFHGSAHCNWGTLCKDVFQFWKHFFFFFFCMKIDNEKAEYHFRKAIELQPKDAICHDSYGMLLYKQLNNYDEALKMFNKAVELKPHMSEAHSHLAEIYNDHFKDFSRAKQSRQIFGLWCVQQ